MGEGIIEHARALGVELPPELDDPTTELTPPLIIDALRRVAWRYFPLLAPDGTGSGHSASDELTRLQTFRTPEM